MAPPKSKADGEGKGKVVATTPSPRMTRCLSRKTRSDTRRSGSSSQLVSLESVEKKKRKTKAKTGGATKNINKKEEGEKEDEEDDDDDAAEEEEAKEEDEDSEKKKIVIEHCSIAAKQSKKISLLVPSDGCLNDRPAVEVIPSVAELSSLFKEKRRSSLLLTNMEKPSPIQANHPISATRKKPFGGSFYLYVHERMGIETKQPGSDTHSINSEEKEKKLNEIDAKVEQIFKEPTQLVSSFEKLKGYLPATPDPSDPLLSMYTSSKVPREDSNSDSLFLTKRLLISGAPENTTPDDIVQFFKKKGIDIESVELQPPDERNLFRGVVTSGADVIFKSTEDANTACKLSGKLMKVEQQELPIFVNRFRNDFRIIHISGLDKIFKDKISVVLNVAFDEERLVKTFIPDASGIGFVLVLADSELKKNLLGGSYDLRFEDDDIDCAITLREAFSLKPEYMKNFLSDDTLEKMKQMEKRQEKEKKMQQMGKKKSRISVKRRKRN